MRKRVAKWLAVPSFLRGIIHARGYIDNLVCTPERVAIQGWMLNPETGLTTLRVFLNNELVGSTEIGSRPDVARAFPWIPHAARSGVRLDWDGSKGPRVETGRVDLVGYHGALPVARLSSLYRTDLDDAVPTPPQHLMHRVANTRDGRFFKIWGLKCYGDFLEILRRHCDLARPAALLDWGCGCGRLTAHFLSEPGFAVFGCDVDREAVTWCESNLRAGQFTTIDPFPPTPYPDGSFQLAIGYSIFTHLTKDLQFAWLAELQRILAPGGILVATVHGDSAASFAFPGQVSTVLEHGFYDGVHDTVLDGIVPQGYYRGTFQTQEYTLREWGKYFDILEYEVRGIGNHQDAVVMRSRA